jgi:hypothetical protein
MIVGDNLSTTHITMPATFPPLAALFLTYFHDLKGQEVAYYVSLSNGMYPPGEVTH